jgi:hypothetical protein
VREIKPPISLSSPPAPLLKERENERRRPQSYFAGGGAFGRDGEIKPHFATCDCAVFNVPMKKFLILNSYFLIDFRIFASIF